MCISVHTVYCLNKRDTHSVKFSNNNCISVFKFKNGNGFFTSERLILTHKTLTEETTKSSSENLLCAIWMFKRNTINTINIFFTDYFRQCSKCTLLREPVVDQSAGQNKRCKPIYYRYTGLTFLCFSPLCFKFHFFRFWLLAPSV